jgi:hypothetical protein
LLCPDHGWPTAQRSQRATAESDELLVHVLLYRD